MNRPNPFSKRGFGLWRLFVNTAVRRLPGELWKEPGFPGSYRFAPERAQGKELVKIRSPA